MSKDQYFKRLESLFSTTEPVEPEPSNGKAAVATSAELLALRARLAETEAALAEARQQSTATQQFESQQQAETSALRERVAELEAALAEALTQSVRTVDQNTGTVGQDVARAANEGEEVYRDGKPYATRGVFHDITQLKQADESLRRQNEYLAALQKITVGLIGRLDLNELLEDIVARAGELVGASHGYIFLHEPGDDAMQMHVGVGTYSSFVGYRIQPGGAVVGKVWQTGQPLVIDDYQAWADRLNLTNLEPVHAVIGVPLKSGAEVVGVLGLAHADPGRQFGEGEVGLVNRFAQLASVALDNAKLYASAQKDLAERKQAEEELLKFKLGLERSTDAVFMTDTSGQILYTNPAFEKVYGYSREEAVGNTPRILKSGVIPPEGYRQFWQTLLAKGTVAGEIVNKTKDGRLINVEGSNNPILDDAGNIIGFLAAHRDITERKKAEEALHEREEDLEALLEFSPEAIGVVNTQTGLFESVNVAAERLYRLRREELVKVGPAQMSPDLQPDGRPSAEKAMEKIKEALEGGSPVFEWTHCNATGQLIACEVRLVGLTGKRQHLVRFSVTDITERKRAEAALQYRAEVEKLVSEISTSFVNVSSDRVDDEINHALQKLGEFAGVDRTYVFQFSLDGATMDNTHEWCAEGITPFIDSLKGVPSDTFPYLMAQIRNGEVFHVPHVAELPSEASTEKAEFEKEGIRSIVVVPVAARGILTGFVGFDAVRAEKTWTGEDIVLIRLIGEIFATTLERKQAEEALAKRASELAMVAQVSTAASTIQDVQHMLQTVVDTTKSSFNLYHAHIYLLNASGDTLVLTAGAGEVGKQMVTQGRRIPVSQEQSLVARAARTRQGVIVNDVQTDPGFLPNPLLPGTRSEMAVPMIIGGQVLGVFDVQSEAAGRFTSEDDSIQTTLAAQVAAALQNARSHEQAEKALKDLNALTRRLTREGWGGYLESQPSSRLAYAYDLNQIIPLDADDQAAESKGIAIERPLTLRGETIGRVTIAEAEKVDEEAQAVVAAVAEQLTAHIESLRLTEEALAAQQQSELRAVELEAIAKVSAAASTILDADTLLQTVVDLTKESLVLYHAHIYLLDETGDALILAAGAGEVGRKMAATGRTIPVNREHSLVARAARTRRGVIANDVSQEPDFLPNSLLPDTRSEMAVPMILGDTLLGVFDVQADTVNRFSGEDVRLKTTLAEQVAVALQNARLYAEQASTVERLRELDQLKSSFLANMSHELRTPLNSILGFTQVMIEGIDGDLTDRMENDLSIIQKNGQHLLDLISDILDMAKIEAGKMTLNPEIFDLKEVLDEVLDIAGPLARAKSLDLIVNAGSESAMDIYADRMRLRQVMINLVNNAVKFTETGYIEIAAGRSEGLFRIAVRDTGISIPVDHLETIFQEFSQVDSSTTRKTGGTGLGLPISRHLIELHGGRLWAESTGIPGEGSSFIIELPVEAPYEDGSLESS